MRRIAVLTPDPAEPRYADRWPPYFEPLRAAFAARGIEAVPIPWPDEARDVGASVALLSWGYHFQPDRWRERLARGDRLINARELLSWNTRKTYLAELGEAGAPVVPTHFVEAANAGSLDAAFEAFGVDTLVAKPQVSAGAHLTVKVARGAPLPALSPGAAMLQPFLSAVAGEGELSLFYFGGRFSHAVRKVAAEGDFRIQPQYGGRLTLFQPDGEALAAAEAALAAAPGPVTYARVDLIRSTDGRLALMELEAIEPDLYLNLDPGVAPRFAQAMVGALDAG